MLYGNRAVDQVQEHKIQQMMMGAGTASTTSAGCCAGAGGPDVSMAAAKDAFVPYLPQAMDEDFSLGAA